MENQTETTPLETTSDAQTALAPDPFSDDNWVEAPAQTAETTQTEIPQEQKTEVPQGTKEEEEIFDADEYLKRELGFDNWDAAKNELAELKKLRETASTPAEIKFANDESKKFFEYVKEGKKAELYNFLQEQQRLETILSKDNLKADDAAELVKLSMQLKYKDLTPDEINYKFNKQFSMPAKPTQSDLETQEEYDGRVAEWQQLMSDKQMELMIEAKLAKPELTKYKQDLVLPDINKPENQQQQQGLSPEELDKIKTAYRQSIDVGLQKFNGYDITASALNGEVKIPISYSVTNEEKAAQKAALEGFNMDEYFSTRWLNEDGSYNAGQLANDKYLLDNRDKIFQKIANDAANKAYEHFLKTRTNSNVNGKTGAGTFNPDSKTVIQKQADAIWDA